MSEPKIKFAPLNPTYVGHWVIGDNCYFSILTKPTDEQIKNTEEMFGWKWKDKITCNKCNDTGWVCEWHPDKEAHKCCGGAGMPCECIGSEK
jgi:hypothetical protein